MSYDISLHIPVDTGGPELLNLCTADIGNYTSNVSGMWTAALGHRLADLHHKNAGESLSVLQRAVTAMESDPDTYRAMNPPNGWGDYQGALNYLRALRDACATHPKCTISISISH